MNALMVIQPYKHNGVWMFDDEARGLVAEPFVAGIPEIIEDLIERHTEMSSEEAENGFTVVISSSPFPEHQAVLALEREDMGGNWYKEEETEYEGWLCPAMYKFFEEAPERIYIQVQE